MRQWRPEDFDDLAACHGDPEVARFIGGVCDRAESWRRLATIVGHWQPRGYGMWALEEKGSGDFCGSVGLWFPEGWPELEVGYWLARAKQGRGYAAEAVIRSRVYAHEVLGADGLVSYPTP